MFAVPRCFRITKYHIFLFEKECMGRFKAKYLSTTEQYDEFSILKPGVTKHTIITETAIAMNDPKFVSPIVRLEDVPSQKEGNRKEYLVKNVCKRYYPNDECFVEKYFGNGDI